MNTFKISNKKIHTDSRSSIEDIHNEKMSKINLEIDSLDSKKKELHKLNELLTIYIDKSESRIKIFELQQKIKELKNKIHDIENHTELLDYIFDAKDFIENIDNDEINISYQKNDTEGVSKVGILNYINKTGTINKGDTYNKYLQKCFNQNNTVPYNLENFNNLCKLCKSPFEIDTKESLLICTHCGVCEKHTETIFNNFGDNYSPDSNNTQFSYQRKNHFKEWLNQLQAKEVTIIPDVVIELVIKELQKERIEDINDIDSVRIKKYLKKLKLNKYYEHIPNLISRITNKPPLKITDEFNNILMDLFDKIQEPFKKHCPKNRKNFLSYSYTLHKFCQLLGKREYLIYFPLLKSREKLFEQEKIWKDICNDLNWDFIPSI